jgi:flagellin-like protein
MSNLRPLNRFKKNAKAISPLIATLLLIAIAVAASVLTYSWVMSMIGTQSQQAQTQIRTDTVTWHIAHGAANSSTIVVRNTGSVAATIESIAIRYSSSGSTYYSVAYTGSNSVDTGKTLAFTWTETGASAPTDFLKPTTEYSVRITTTTGFQYEAVTTSPSS